MTVILGISAFYHDSAAAIIVDGEIVAAAQEERFTRRKHDAGFPGHAVRFVLEHAGLKLSEVEYVAFYDKPFLKFERLLETYVAAAPDGFRSFLMGMPVWLREKLFQKSMLMRELKKIDPAFRDADRLLFAEHHYSHAASAYYPSPFQNAVVLTLDGVGEWATTTVAIGRGENLEMVREIRFPHSLGLLYSAFTYYLGFKVNSGEYKVMGLAPYGEPRFKDLILDNIVDLKEDGSYHLNMDYFNYLTGLTMTGRKFEELFGAPARKPESDLLTQFHMDMAASIQAVTEEVVLKITRSLADEFGIPNLCMAGGVALNCVANGEILRQGAFNNIWVQPAAGDAGGAIGAALAVWHRELGQPRHATNKDRMQGAYLGPEYSQSAIEQQLTSAGAVFETFDEAGMLSRTVDALVEGKAIGWFQGRMEFGPRALGARSIIGDPRSPEMQKTLNLKVKYRESFRPFAPSVLYEDVAEWFDLDYESPYMLLVADILKEHCFPMSEEDQQLFGIDKLNVPRSTIPAVTHVDYSARVQTVHADTNPLYHRLISGFKERTGCPIVVNTSFNIRGEPIVLTPVDAFRCFMGTDLELLVCGNAVMTKEAQRPDMKLDYRNAHDLD